MFGLPTPILRSFHEARGKAFGNARLGEPKETPWDSREITITDPAGNFLTFYTDAQV